MASTFFSEIWRPAIIYRNFLTVIVKHFANSVEKRTSLKSQICILTICFIQNLLFKIYLLICSNGKIVSKFVKVSLTKLIT